MAAPLRLYRALSRWRILRASYRGKILFVAFLGTHVPLLALLCYVLVWSSLSASLALRVLLVALVATLGSTAATVYALSSLLQPIGLIADGLRTYVDTRQLPSLPLHFADDVGRLMAYTQRTLTQLHTTIRHAAAYDPLTGLLNRTGFHESLEQALVLRSAASQEISLIVLDLDGFKALNNGYGQRVGDQLLLTIVERLREEACGDTLARLGGDEFAVLHLSPAAEDLCEYIARLQGALARPVVVAGQSVFVSASMGVALAPDDGDTAAALLQHADTAMGLAQRTGPGQYAFYAAALNERLERQLALEHDLRAALDHGEFRVVYQPQFDLRHGRLTGVEALLRWDHPRRGLVAPAEYIPVAEANGLIVPIGEWVLREACRQGRAWQLAGLRSLRIAVNLSARQCAEPQLVATVREILAATGFDPGLLQLEVTESAVMEDIDRAIEVLEELRALGVTVALDDFGTGHSSLSYLQRFPITTLKIDRSFVQDVAAGAHAGMIVDALIHLGHSLELEVLAEGVETEAQRDRLRRSGCDKLQGYLLSRPLPAQQVPALVLASAALGD